MKKVSLIIPSIKLLIKDIIGVWALKIVLSKKCTTNNGKTKKTRMVNAKEMLKLIATPTLPISSSSSPALTFAE